VDARVPELCPDHGPVVLERADRRREEELWRSRERHGGVESRSEIKRAVSASQKSEVRDEGDEEDEELMRTSRRRDIRSGSKALFR